MQIRYATNLSAEEYVSQQAWREAKLERCPLHPEGGCRFHRHGTYHRQYPAGTQIARWYCIPGHTTFGLLPDCLSSRLRGTLLEAEESILEVERAASQEKAAEKIRIDIDLPGALRWIRRRLLLIKATLSMLSSLVPSVLSGLNPTISSFRKVLCVGPVLPYLRHYAQDHLYALPPPVGFGPYPPKKGYQQQTGTDPPAQRI